MDLIYMHASLGHHEIDHGGGLGLGLGCHDLRGGVGEKRMRACCVAPFDPSFNFQYNSIKQTNADGTNVRRKEEGCRILDRRMRCGKVAHAPSC